MKVAPKPPPPSPEARAKNTIVWKKNNTDFLCNKDPHKVRHEITEEQIRAGQIRRRIERIRQERELQDWTREIWE